MASRATITSNAVSRVMGFWMSNDAWGLFLKALSKEG
jgi:Na+-transporting NADH:ubiquinone oxidoreductase subunit NqrC